MMRILFVGCVESSYRLLAELMKKEKQIVGVITKDSSAFNADYMDLRPLCEKQDIPCHYVKNINDVDSLEFIRSCQADICYCFGWSQLLRKECIDLFPQGVVGFHPAALPCNRGRHPLIWALALGLEETASTFFMIDAGADEGAIISQRPVGIDYEDDARTLYDKVMETAVEQVGEFTDELEQGKATLSPQDISAGNTWRKRSKNDGRIDWRMSSRSIYNLVRSLTKPYVGAHFEYADREYKVWKAAELPASGMENIEPGKVLAIHPDGTIDVKAGSDAVRLLEHDELEINAGDYL